MQQDYPLGIDRCFSVRLFSQFLSQPPVPYLTEAHKLLWYVKGSLGQGLFFPDASPLQLTGYYDSDWASCLDTRKSTTGYCVLLDHSLISWKSKKQSIISRSSKESKISLYGYCYLWLAWLRCLLTDLGIVHPQPALLYCDNKAALHISSNLVFHEHTKHIELDCHLVRDKIADGTLPTAHVPSASQLADILRKPCILQVFENICPR